MEEIDVEALSHSDDCGIADIDVEDPLSSLRSELKEIRNRITALRKNAKSCDKKQKKILQEEISSLEALSETKKLALESRQQKEQGDSDDALKEKVAALRAKKQQKITAKKDEEVRLREESAYMASMIPNLGKVEQEGFQKVLSSEGLIIHDIDPDGNCLFNALAHQIFLRHDKNFGQEELRRIAANYINANADKYAGFLEEPVEEYCEKLKNSSIWGGHLELDALGAALGFPIIVYQANVDPIHFGDSQSNDAPLRICFQKYAYSLGEHYDSLIDDPEFVDQ